MKKRFFILTLVATFILTACQGRKSACPQPTGTLKYLTTPPEALSTPTRGASPTPVQMKIKGKNILFDKVIEGPLCNDTWSGTVYVTCNVQVYPWEEEPTFLKNCKLTIEPDTVVYVAYHNNSAYYKGCSCHTGEIARP
jgi:hypothetical protein